MLATGPVGRESLRNAVLKQRLNLSLNKVRWIDSRELRAASGQPPSRHPWPGSRQRCRGPATGMPGAAHRAGRVPFDVSETGRAVSESRIGGTNGAKPGTPEAGVAQTCRQQGSP